jgi:DNA polymerase elongation subunit (family B)
MTAEDITQQDLVISKLLRQDIEKYKSLFPHVSAAIQLSNSTTDRRYPAKGDTINYIYTNTQHKNPLCRIAALDSEKDDGKNKGRTLNYYIRSNDTETTKSAGRSTGARRLLHSSYTGLSMGYFP